jgi:modulator of FtsH protease HflK
MRYVLYLIALLFAVYTVATSFTQVQSHERAVVRRFGRVLEHKPEQGLYIGLPWGIDRVELAPVGRLRTITVGFNEKEDRDDEVTPPGQLLTGDHNLVNVQASINFRASENAPEKYILQKDNIDAFVARAAESLLAEWIAAHEVKEILRTGKGQLPGFLLASLPERLRDYELGVVIESIAIKKLEPPGEVKAAFDNLTQAEASIPTKRSQALETVDRKKSMAQGEINDIERKAEMYAPTERKNAQTEADNFRKRLTQYQELSRANPEYINALWLDGMTRIYGKMREEGRIELLDHYLTKEGLTITQFPLVPRKK